MRLRTKAALAFGGVFAACAIAVLLLTLTLENSSAKILEITKENRPADANLTEIQRCYNELQVLVQHSIAHPADIDNARHLQTTADRLKMLHKDQQNLIAALEGITKLVPYLSPDLLSQMQTHPEKILRLAAEIIKTAQKDAGKAKNLYDDQYREIHGSLATTINAVKAQLDHRQRQELAGTLSSVNNSTRLVATAIVLILLAIFAITLGANRYIISQVQNLRDATAKFADGDLESRAAAGRNDEFGELAKTFNVMAHTLQQQTLQLRRHSELLQKRVEEKTRELKTKAGQLEQKNVELEQANRELSRLDDMKNDFVSMASHELRTPLTSIHGSLELLAKGQAGAMPDDAPQFLEVCRRNTKRLIALVEELLDLSRIDRGQLSLNPERIEIRELVQEIFGSFAMLAQSRNVALANHAPEDIAVWADRGKTAQILTNLLSNAIKFTSDGSVEVTAASRNGQDVEISVTDTGMGISPEALPHIFDRFTQAGTPETRAAGGAGLGLAITKLLIERQGGSIKVQSAPGKGSTFTFTLPLFSEQKVPAPSPS